jgi:hypothetical protein
LDNTPDAKRIGAEIIEGHFFLHHFFPNIFLTKNSPPIKVVLFYPHLLPNPTLKLPEKAIFSILLELNAGDILNL